MPFLKFLLTANSSYSLHLIKLKLDVLLDHDVEQRILFWGYRLHASFEQRYWRFPFKLRPWD